MTTTIAGPEEFRATWFPSDELGDVRAVPRHHSRDNYSLGWAPVFDDLDQLAQECREPNWDGYGASPVTAAAVSLARQFLNVLPVESGPFSVGAIPSGDVTFEWYRSPRNTLSVIVDLNGQIHYAALLGASSVHGSEFFWGEVPPRLLTLIHDFSLFRAGGAA